MIRCIYHDPVELNRKIKMIYYQDLTCHNYFMFDTNVKQLYYFLKSIIYKKCKQIRELKKISKNK